MFWLQIWCLHPEAKRAFPERFRGGGAEEEAGVAGQETCAEQGRYF
jgi:hypothetical protein